MSAILLFSTYVRTSSQQRADVEGWLLHQEVEANCWVVAAVNDLVAEEGHQHCWEEDHEMAVVVVVVQLLDTAVDGNSEEAVQILVEEG